MKTLLELDDKFQDCRFPVMADFFCGDPAQEKSSYCVQHHPVCWERVQAKPAKAGVYHGTDFAA